MVFNNVRESSVHFRFIRKKSGHHFSSKLTVCPETSGWIAEFSERLMRGTATKRAAYLPIADKRPWSKCSRVSRYTRPASEPLDQFICRLRRIKAVHGRGAGLGCRAPANPRMTRRSRFMRYAAADKLNSEPLEQFVKRKGGINKCVTRFSVGLGRRRRSLAGLS
jgi:hypothetical protein